MSYKTCECEVCLCASRSASKCLVICYFDFNNEQKWAESAKKKNSVPYGTFAALFWMHLNYNKVQRDFTIVSQQEIKSAWQAHCSANRWRKVWCSVGRSVCACLLNSNDSTANQAVCKNITLPMTKKLSDNLQLKERTAGIGGRTSSNCYIP